MNIDGSIITYTGRLFWPLQPRIEDINLLDICHALSNQCRFTGHTIQFYSVAEHSCRVHDILPDQWKLAGLLHDASEAYLMDLAKPVKVLEDMKTFCEYEDEIMIKVFKKFGLEYPFSPAIKIADRVLLNTEYRDLMTKNKLKEHSFNGWHPLPHRINPWSPEKAKYAMIDRLEKLGLKVTK